MALEEKAAEYFSSMSGLSKRIMEERDFVKNQCQDQWKSMTHEEREDLIYDYFVSPKLQEKYSSTLKLGGDAESFPKLLIDSGARVVEDEMNSWNDEHSAPFSWETKSQLNFSYIDHNERNSVMSETKSERDFKRQNRLKHLRNSILGKKNESALNAEPTISRISVISSDECEVPQTVNVLRNAVKNDVEAVLQDKLKKYELGVNEEMDENNFSDDLDDDDQAIPKSGFDFLDEW